MKHYHYKSGSTRRDVLQAFLGLPLALLGCATSEENELSDGEIIGTSHDVGHRLRDGWRPEVPENHWSAKSVVIVGGGVAGLSAAWRLLKSGFNDFVLLELESEIGGTSRSGKSSIVGYPWGAHYVPVPLRENRLLIRLLHEMRALDGEDSDGHPIAKEQFLCRDPQERVFFRGRWYEGLYLHSGATSEDLRQLAAFHAEVDRWVAWRDAKGRRAFTIPVASCSEDVDVTQLDRISMAEWLRGRRLTSPRLHWLIDYSCRDDYGLTLDQTSAWAGLFYFASRKRAPQAASQPVITWPEGNGRLVSHLHTSAREQSRVGFAVANLAPRERGVDVTAIDVAKHRIVGIHAEQVIFAAPQFTAPFLIEPFRDRAPPHVGEFEYGAWMVANVHLKDRPQSEGFPLSWDNVLYESPSLGYVAATHQALRDHGATVFTYYYPLCDANPRDARYRLLNVDWKSWADVVLTDLTRAHPNVRSLATRLDVMRWGHAMVRPRPDFIWSTARREARRPRWSIHFANTDLSGVPLFEEALHHGVRAAEEVLSERGIEHPSML